MKKVMVIVFCYVCVLASIYTVNASSYLNQFGVNIEQSIYEKMSRYYDKEYIDIITKEQYESIVSNDFENIVIISSDNEKVAKSSSELSTDYKTLKLIVNGNFVTASLNWKKQPKVKNYDVMAIRNDGNLNISNISGYQIYGTNNSKINNFTTFSNGVGASFKLQSNISKIYYSFNIKGNGNLFLSYQHATTYNLSYTESKNYYLSQIGLGNVIKFNNSTTAGKYDNMSGISYKV